MEKLSPVNSCAFNFIHSYARLCLLLSIEVSENEELKQRLSHSHVTLAQNK